MATRDARLKIAIEGEQAYKQALSELNKGTSVLNSEMKKLSAEYKDNENSTEALTKKGDILQRQLLQQKDKVETLRAALANAAQEFGEADKRTQDWQIKLNQAEAAEIDLQRAIDANNEALKRQETQVVDTGKALPTLGEQVDKIADKFGVRIPDGIKTALDHVNGFSTGTVVAMGAAVAGIAAVETAIKAISFGIEQVEKLHKMTLEEASWADDLLTRSQQTGLSTGLLQSLDYAQKFLDFDGIDKSLVKLTSSMDKARDGAAAQASAFETLGISVTGTDGALRDNWEVFKETIDALGQIENATEADVLANDLFGKSYAELKPLINAGSGSLEDFIKAAQDAGYVLDDSQIQKLGEVDDAYQEYQAQIEATKQKLAVEFAPISTQVMQLFGDAASEAGQTLIDSGILETLGDFLTPLGEIMGALIEVAQVILPALVGPLETAAHLFSALADAIAWVASQLASVDWGKLNAMNNSSKYGWGINAAGTDNWRGGLTWVGENGPELVSLPRGSQIYTNQQSRQIASGDTYYNITVANVRELDEIINWFESRRIRGRMA